MSTPVNIAGTSLASPTNTVTLTGFSTSDIVQFSKSLAASSGGLLTYDAYSLEASSAATRHVLDSKNNTGGGSPTNGGIKGGWLLPDALFSGASEGSAYTALNSDGNATSLEIYICGGVFGNIGTSGNTDLYHWQGGAGTGVLSDFGSTTRTGFNHSSTLINVYHLLSIHSATNDRRMYMNGVSAYASATNTAAFAATGKRLGWSQESGQNFQFDGKHSDVVFTRNATTLRDEHTGYLAHKMGITLPAGHPYEFGPPTKNGGADLWDPLDDPDLEAWWAPEDLPDSNFPFLTALANNQTWTDRSPNAYVATLSVSGAATATRWDNQGYTTTAPTWLNAVDIYGNNGGSDVLLFSVPRYPEFTTSDAAFDSIADLLPFEVSGYHTYKVTAVNDAGAAADNRGGFSILAAVVGTVAPDLVDSFTVEVSFSGGYTISISDSFAVEVTTDGTANRDPPFECGVLSADPGWECVAPGETSWSNVAAEEVTWLCADEVTAEPNFDVLAYADDDTLEDLDGQELKMIG